MKKQQVVFIHGGEVFDNYQKYLEALKSWEYEIPTGEKPKRWKYDLEEKLPDFDFIFPSMPSKFNAKYIEWKIWFEKVLEKTDRDLIFIGHSLGGTFLLKYFSENKIDKKIKALFLVAAAIDNPDHGRYQMDTFNLNKGLVSKLDNKIKNIFAAQSKDDCEVPFSDFETLIKLLPNVEKMVFEDRGHFLGEEFPEIVEKIKELK